MIGSVLQGIRNALANDATLTALGFGPAHVILGWISKSVPLPAISIIESGESVQPRVGYNTGLKRDHSSAVQIDIWVDKEADVSPCSTEDVDAVASQIDVVLFRTGVTSTKGWRRDSSSGPAPEGSVYHKSLRYSFGYTAKDT